MRAATVARVGVGSGPPPPFDPLSLSPLIRLKASSITGLSSGDPVATWPDTSGNARDASQATSAKRPTWVTGVLNGKAVVRFDVTDDGMVTGLTQSSGEFSVWVVFNYRNASVGNRRAVQGSNNWLIGPYAGKHQTFNGNFLPDGPTVVQNVFVERVLTQSATVAEHFVGNTSYGTRTASPAYPGVMGLGSGGGIVEQLDGDVAEFMVFSGVLSAGNRSDLHGYALAEYGI